MVCGEWYHCGAQEIERARIFLMNDEWHGTVNFHECMVYDPTEGKVEGRERFWNDLDRVVNRVGNGYRLCALGHLNGLVRDRLMVGITGGFGEPE